MSIRVHRLLPTLACVWLALPVQAQWVEQTIHLEPGWNAV